jgi:hypothetical protein
MMLMRYSAIIPATIKVAQGLFLVNAVIWVFFGAATLVRMADSANANTFALLEIAALMGGNAVLMFAAGLGLRTQRRVCLHFAFAVLIVNIVLTITDEFGLFDLITLLINVVILGLLIAARGHFAAGETTKGAT